MALSLSRTEMLSKSVREELTLLDGCWGRDLPDAVLARLANRISMNGKRVLMNDLAAATLAAEALQINPRPVWVERIAGPHPAVAAIASEHTAS